jgi:hypothetical protein
MHNHLLDDRSVTLLQDLSKKASTWSGEMEVSAFAPWFHCQARLTPC